MRNQFFREYHLQLFGWFFSLRFPFVLPLAFAIPNDQFRNNFLYDCSKHFIRWIHKPTRSHVQHMWNMLDYTRLFFVFSLNMGWIERFCINSKWRIFVFAEIVHLLPYRYHHSNIECHIAQCKPILESIQRIWWITWGNPIFRFFSHPTGNVKFYIIQQFAFHAHRDNFTIIHSKEKWTKNSPLRNGQTHYWLCVFNHDLPYRITHFLCAKSYRISLFEHLKCKRTYSNLSDDIIYHLIHGTRVYNNIWWTFFGGGSDSQKVEQTSILSHFILRGI